MKPERGIHSVTILLAALVLIACAREPRLGEARVTEAHTEPTRYTPAVVPSATSASQTPVPKATPTARVAACSESNTVYNIEAVLDWTRRTLQVSETVTFRNDTGQPLNTLALAFPAVIAPEDLNLKHVSVDGVTLRDYILNEGRLTLPLQRPLAPEGTVQAHLAFDLAIPPIRPGYRQGHLGYWGYSSRQINLGLWFPQIPPYIEGNGWVQQEFWPVGETATLRAAHHNVELQVQNAPDSLRVAGPGTFVRSRPDTWRFELCGSRELSLSLSDQFALLTTSTASGIPVELFMLSAGDERAIRAARHALQTAADAVDLYEDRFGTFPFSRLVVVEGDFPDGMEFSGLVFVSEAWFRTWQDVPNDWLTLITAHEVAHQWWYAAVGNDQSRAPYLDEALATYSELIFMEHYHPSLVGWWWDFRVNSYAPSGHVDASITDFDSPRAYINTVYLRGARMMHALRLALGDEEFFAWLANYARTMRGKVAQPAGFWGAMNADTYARTAAIRAEYLSDDRIVTLPDVIP